MWQRHPSIDLVSEAGLSFSRSTRSFWRLSPRYRSSTYILFALHIVAIGPNTNPLGEVCYWYILSGDNSYQHVDPGILSGAIEDAFLLGPLYFATGLGLARDRRWVYLIGLITGAMILYAIIGFFLSDSFAGLNTVTNGVSYWASNLPYLIYPLLLIATLLVTRKRFTSPGSN
jgi:emopamil binding protein